LLVVKAKIYLIKYFGFDFNFMKNRTILILGDLIALGLITLFGFSSHGELGFSYLPRMAASFFPISIAWFLISPWFGLFRKEIICNARQLWRPMPVILIAGPLAALMRGSILGSPVIPIFVIVLTLTSGLGLIAWRTLYFLFTRLSGC
jgi:hypothetical protein